MSGCCGRRSVGGYVGIKNGGATCYMNSLFQQLYMQPSIRQVLLAGPEVEPEERPDSVFYQLQVSRQSACIAGGRGRSTLEP